VPVFVVAMAESQMSQYATTWFRIGTYQRAVTTLAHGLISGVIVAAIMVGVDLLTKVRQLQLVRADRAGNH